MRRSTLASSFGLTLSALTGGACLVFIARTLLGPLRRLFGRCLPAPVARAVLEQCCEPHSEAVTATVLLTADDLAGMRGVGRTGAAAEHR